MITAATSQSTSSIQPSSAGREVLLEIRGLAVHFETRRGVAKAVNDVDLSLYKGERFGLVGESGSGKSTLILSLLNMIKPPGRIVHGSAKLNRRELTNLDGEEVRQLRLSEIAMIPQGAMNSMNPVMRIGDQLELAMAEHGGGEHSVRELMEMVGLSEATERLYPHELSGGMKQRACIAQAISLSPKLILADEPTSALDVVVQRQIMQTLKNLQNRLHATVLLVGHDMGLMAQFAERVGIMYGGELVEVGEVDKIFVEPKHPYTRLLIDSISSFETKGDFRGIPGNAMSLLNPPSGCHFHPRCPNKMDKCQERPPTLKEIAPDHTASCLLYEEGENS
ncbi:MAG: ABC transporter ATP-binding protein [Candidatus Latescibacterota bacterium]|nr:ABC transporter ATP-binding protein [Candidatus Latescibacterota bacterium]